MSEAQRLTRQLRGRWYGGYGVVRCPAHDDREPSLVLRDGQERLLVRCYAGCDAGDVLRKLRSSGALGDGQANAVRLGKDSNPAPALDRERRALLAREIWGNARPAAGTRTEAYLRARGITIAPPLSLRFARALWHAPSRRKHPAMVAAVQGPAGDVRGVHRTYLAGDGAAKAAISPAKMMLGDCSGGAVRLGAAGGELAIGEGIETCLSFLQATGIPTWAALSTSGMRTVALPPLPRAALVYLIVDADAAGEASAAVAAQRLAAEGRRVKLARPTVGKDVNDALRAAADAA